MAEVVVSRVGTQVVVRVSGGPGEADADRLALTLAEIARIVTNRVVVDLDDADEIDLIGIEFIMELQRRWRVRLLNAPPGVRARCRADEQAG